MSLSLTKDFAASIFSVYSLCFFISCTYMCYLTKNTCIHVHLHFTRNIPIMFLIDYYVSNGKYNALSNYHGNSIMHAHHLCMIMQSILLTCTQACRPCARNYISTNDHSIIYNYAQIYLYFLILGYLYALLLQYSSIPLQ